MSGLIYVGGGFVAGVPARDLNEDEVKKYGREFLLRTELYVLPPVKEKPQPAENKIAAGPQVNKGEV